MLLFMRTVLKLTAADEQKKKSISDAIKRFTTNISYFHDDPDLEFMGFVDMDEIIEKSDEDPRGFRPSGEAMCVVDMIMNLRSSEQVIMERVRTGGLKDPATAYGYHVISKEVIDDLITIRNFFESMYDVCSAYVTKHMQSVKKIVQQNLDENFLDVELQIDNIIISACKAREINQNSEFVTKMLRNTKIDPVSIDPDTLFTTKYNPSDIIVADIDLIVSKMPEFDTFTNVELRPYMVCPLSGQVMKAAVMASDSNVYDFDHIKDFFIQQLESGFVTMDISSSSSNPPEAHQLMPNPKRDGFMENTSVVTIPTLNSKISHIGKSFSEWSDHIYYGQ